MSYVTLGTLKGELGILDSQDDTRLQAAIDAAVEQIDSHCGRSFLQDASAVERTYVCDHPRHLPLPDDISTKTGLVVAIDENDDGTFERTLTDGTDFVLLPANAVADGEPFTELQMVGDYDLPRKERPTLSVTAQFGWATVPDAVASATSLQAKNLYKATGAGTFGSMQLSVDGIPMRLPMLDPLAIGLLKRYRRVVL